MFLHKNRFAAISEIKRDFLFNNETSALFPVLNEIISFIRVHLPSRSHDGKISNCKQILIELLTNAVKHSGTKSTVLSVSIMDNKIEIGKSDTGRQFYLDNYTGWPPITWPISKRYIGEKIRIYEDDISDLYAIIQNENQIVFELQEYPVQKLRSDSNLLEHYGLLILTKMSDEFIYAYDPAICSNLFKVVIALDY